MTAGIPRAHPARPGDHFRQPYSLALRLGILAAALLGLAGCQTDDAETNREKLKTKQVKEDFELPRLSTQPYGLETVESTVKPGHWTTVAVDAVANNFDWPGDLASRPRDLAGVPFRLGSTRPVALAKGQRKTLEMVLYLPPELRPPSIALDLRGAGGATVEDGIFPVQRMPAHQFYLVVLAGLPDRYRFLRGLDCVLPEAEDAIDPLNAAHYRVVLPKIDRVVPLAANPLTWTNIAYLVWDELDPALLTTEQQSALLDWLHWGGQLVVSGPASLDQLRASFLGPYLPAEGRGTWTLGPAEAASLGAWAEKIARPLGSSRTAWAGERLEPALGGLTLLAQGAEPLVVERPVGRGRVVVTAFRLAERELLAWEGYDAFWNGCLLRRPPRVFRRANSVYDWRWQDHPDRAATDYPARISRLEYFTRDPWHQSLLRDALAEATDADSADVLTTPDELEADPGVAGWNDNGEIAAAVRGSLQHASGLKIPDLRFVARALGAYLLVLVPVNWLVFRLLGRVEWAWAAVPALALGFAFLVARLAQLDIGFARAENETGVIELQPGYARAHVTRYTSLYSSLSTPYTLSWSEPSALALPFSLGGGQLLADQDRLSVVYRRDRRVRLEDFLVSSNSLGVIHSEYQLNLEGTLELSPDGNQIDNRLRFDLRGAGLIGPRGTAWIGEFPAGARRDVAWVAWPAEDTADDAAPRGFWADERDRQPETSRAATAEAINVRGLLELAETRRSLDETRLVAWTSADLPGLEVAPRAAQRRRTYAVVAHLGYGPPPAAVADHNSRAQLGGAPRRDPGAEHERPPEGADPLSGAEVGPNDPAPPARPPAASPSSANPAP